MKVLIAAYFEFIKDMRDIKMFLFLVIAPLLTTMILGTAVQGYFSGDIGKKISVGYVNQDIGVIGKEFDKFLKNDEINKRLIVKKYEDKAEAQKNLNDSKIDVCIYLPQDLSQSLSGENRETIKIYGKKNIEFIESIVRGFTASYNSAEALISIGEKPSTVTASPGSIKRIYFTKDMVVPKAIDYYGVLTLLQMLIVGALFGVFITTKDDNTDLHIRTHALPVRKASLMLGQIIGSVAYVFIGAVLDVLCTKLLFGVNWNGNPLIILGTILMFSCIAVGLGVLTGSLLSNFSTAIMLIMLLMIFFGIFSGSISPVSVNETVKNFIPNYHAKILLFGTIYGYSRQVMLQAALWLTGIMVFIYGAAGLSVRRRKYGNI